MARERSRGRLSPRRGRERGDIQTFASQFETGAQARSLLGGVAATTFLGLGDTPGSFGTAGQVAAVNSGASGIVWQNAGAGDMIIATYDPAGVGGQIVDLDATQILVNKTLTAPILNLSALLSTAGADYTLTWATPASARAISIPDPLGTDVFVFADMVQSLEGKTLVLPTIASFLNAQHDHTSAAAGGALPDVSILQTIGWLTGNSTGMQQVNAVYTTVPLTVVQEFNGVTPTISSGAVVPPADGTYLLDASLGWVADTNNGADKVQVKWQVFNSVTSLWEDIPGH